MGGKDTTRLGTVAREAVELGRPLAHLKCQARGPAGGQVRVRSPPPPAGAQLCVRRGALLERRSGSGSGPRWSAGAGQEGGPAGAQVPWKAGVARWLTVGGGFQHWRRGATTS